ncbi:MAG: hypothetical protein WCQ45_00030 [bacterium]
MKKTSWLLVTSTVLLSVVALGVVGWAQTDGSNAPAATDENRQRPADAGQVLGMFGGGDYAGGYLKYTYTISREGANRTSTTTTEITPLADGTYTVVSTSSETLPLAMVHTGFYGIPLPRLGIHVAENSSGTIDMSPLDNISSSAIEAGKNYILPDGGRFQAGALGTIAGVAVVYGAYTHADYTNVEIQLAFAVDLTIRALLPFPAMMEFRYSSAADQPLSTFSLVKLTEYVRRP